MRRLRNNGWLFAFNQEAPHRRRWRVGASLARVRIWLQAHAAGEWLASNQPIGWRNCSIIVRSQRASQIRVQMAAKRAKNRRQSIL
jgi:hypothetical protein